MTQDHLIQLIIEKLQQVDNPKTFNYTIDNRIWTTTVA